MRSKSFIAVFGVIALLLVAAGGVYAYDSSREDLIAKGVTIGGVDVGGLRADEAGQKLRARLLEPLATPVVAHWKGHHYTLTPRAARVGVNIDRSVQDAVARSRNGGIIDRTVRGLTGGKVDEALQVKVSYDHQAVTRVVRRVRESLERPAVDAKVSFDGGQISKVESRPGLKVATEPLERSLARRLTSTTASRTVKVRTQEIDPKVTTADLAQKYPSVVIVDRGSFALHLYKDLKPAKDYRVAVGQAGLETPQGLYTIQDKQTNPYWHVPQSDWAGKLAGKVIPPGPQNPIKARWMGIYNGAGIHGTDAVNSLGTAASHGCIRMAIPDVEDLYDRVDVGTPVYIL